LLWGLEAALWQALLQRSWAAHLVAACGTAQGVIAALPAAEPTFGCDWRSELQAQLTGYPA
jgi:hypothetical protein